MKFQPRLFYPLAFLGGLAIGFLAYWAVLQFNKPVPSAPPITSLPPIDRLTSPPPGDVTMVPTSSVPEIIPLPQEQATESIYLGQDDQRAILSVAFDVAPKKLSSKEVVTLFQSVTTNTAGVKEAFTGTGDVGDTAPTMWLVGRVSTGDPFEQNPVYVLKLEEEGIGGFYEYRYLVKHDDKMYELSQHGLGDHGSAVLKVDQFLILAPSISIQGLDQNMPTDIALKNGRMIHQSSSSDFGFNRSYVFKFEIGEKLEKIGETKDGQTVYQRIFPVLDEIRTQEEAEGCLMIFGMNGRIFRFASYISGTRDEQTGHIVKPNATWVAGYQNDKTFDESKPSGCGSYDCVNTLAKKDQPVMTALIIAGRTIQGDPIYVPKDSLNDAATKEAYDMWLQFHEQKPTLKDFLNQFPVPFFYWKDAFGRWIKLTTSDLIPPAECGKPVIYLYPEKPTAVSVRLSPAIHVTVSEPTYPDRGWNVVAQPNGDLLMNGTTYGSLYWEGTGVSYSAPHQGFIIKDGQVDQRLRVLLAAYGLNDKESQEFRDFWVPKMTGAPYYRVTFLTSVWSQAAPLSVSPRPTTAIRLFMDWEKLSAPVSLPEPKIVTPIRRGFTLVEWGGLLR